MKTNKKIYWYSFFAQLILAIFAFFKIPYRSWAQLISIYISLIWLLLFLRPEIKCRECKPLDFKIVICITIVFITLKVFKLYSINLRNLIDFSCLLLFNCYLIIDDFVSWIKRRP